MPDSTTHPSAGPESASRVVVERMNPIGDRQDDPMALDPLRPLNPPADTWFRRFNELEDRYA